MRRFLPLALLSAVALTGCSEIGDRISGAADTAVSSAVNALAEKALEDGVRKQLRDAGVELSSGPDCSTDLSRSGSSLTGSANCSAVTVDGHDARAHFDGTLSTSGCTGTITVVVNGQTVVDAEEVPDCSVSL